MVPAESLNSPGRLTFLQDHWCPGRSLSTCCTYLRQAFLFIFGKDLSCHQEDCL